MSLYTVLGLFAVTLPLTTITAPSIQDFVVSLILQLPQERWQIMSSATRHKCHNGDSYEMQTYHSKIEAGAVGHEFQTSGIQQGEDFRYKGKFEDRQDMHRLGKTQELMVIAISRKF